MNLLVHVVCAALAQDPTEPDLARARELFENGRILYEEGSYEQAIVAWQESYRLSQKHALQYNIAGAYEKLGRYREAIAALDQYRAMATAAERPLLDRRIRALEERLAAAPAPAPGPAPAPEPVPVAAPAPAPATVARERAPVGPIVLLGAGAVGLGIGGVSGARALAARGEVREVCVEGDAGTLCPDSAADAVDRHGTSSIVSAISLGLGGALSITGAVWLAAGSGPGDLRVAPWLGEPGASVAGRF